MNDIPEALGEMAAAGLVARAVEPSAGENEKSAELATCLNCAALLDGNYCVNCGQSADIHRTLSAFFHDLVHGVLHFEGKFWRTLPVWIWRPGRLTREYIDGKRAKYISPIALFLFVVFITFASFTALGGGIGLGNDAASEAAGPMQEAYVSVETELEKKRAELDAAVDDPSIRAKLEEEFTELTSQRDAVAALGDVSGVQVDQAQNDDPPGQQTDGFTGENEVRSVWQKAKENPQLLIYKIQTNAYKFAWLLIPLSVPFVWLLFPFRRDFKMYDHTIFVTYSIAFMLSLVGIASLSAYFNAGGLVLPLLLYAPFHLYRQLRGTYDLSRRGAIWRMLVLSIFCWIAILLFVVGLTMAVSG